MKTLILGAGNLLLSDEGFGVHFIRHLQEHCTLPPEVEVFDAGTFGLMAGHKLEEADRVYIVDVIAAPGESGACVRYGKEDFLPKLLPLKLSPHQIGIQEMLLVSSLRARCPKEVFLLGIIPCSVEPGTELSPLLQRRLPELASQLIAEIAASDHVMITAAQVPKRQAPAIGPHPSHQLCDPLKSAHKGNNPSD